ncbi:hypothetical protein FVE85_3228 [Porphyridium purpureum]|uniref:Uncharacterized protein n=1 Tax=Porphyridium purpureum TaxID=35688 RepID=A0A5J4YX02_PORPP|nr:hypothetical protein FVE85_3228 [Porphyridium purpureum]|eukprot:POR1222..scf227_4
MRISAALLAFVTLLALAATVLIAVGLGTDNLIDFSSVGPTTAQGEGSVNYPVRVRISGQSSTFEDQLYTDRYGPFSACLKRAADAENPRVGPVCSTIKWGCDVSLCFISDGQDRVCGSVEVQPLTNCDAFNAFRVIACIAGFFMMFGFIAFLAAWRAPSRQILGAAVLLFGFVMGLVAFALFYAILYVDNGANYAPYGYSLALIIASWPIAMIGGILAFVKPYRKKNTFKPTNEYPAAVDPNYGKVGFVDSNEAPYEPRVEGENFSGDEV